MLSGKTNLQESSAASNQAGKGGKSLPAVQKKAEASQTEQENSEDVDLQATDSTEQAQPTADSTNNNHKAASKPFQLQPDSNKAAENKNDTGLPAALKSGIESLSGLSMNDVKVHYNSDKPAQLQAFAFAQGTDIHVGTGQDKHLPHEAWHVVQQKQGRVKPTMQMKATDGQTGMPIQAAKSVQPKGDAPVQRKVQAVQVAWDITHIVREVDGSLFGGDDFTENEVQQLTAGTKLLIDDGSTFISRRGPNQEDRGKRATEKSSPPSVLWYQVMQLPNGLDVSSRNMYIRSETFVVDNTKEADQLPKEDKYWLEKFASTARQSAENESQQWSARINDCNANNPEKIKNMIRIMSSLKSLGEMIVQFSNNLKVFSDPSTDPRIAIELTAKYLATLTMNSRFIGITVNALMDSTWSSLPTLAKYLANPYDILVSIYTDLNSEDGKRSLFEVLALSETNIEKYTSLMSGKLVQQLASEGGIDAQIEAVIFGHITAKKSAESLVIGVAADFCGTYMKEKNNDEAALKKEYFYEWLDKKGFTLKVLETALTGQKLEIKPSEVASFWNKVVDDFFSLYDDDV
jgi:hypothetical protein